MEMLKTHFFLIQENKSTLCLLFNKFKSLRGTASHGVLCPMALAGKLLWNLARTVPPFPQARVNLPHITLVLFGLPPESLVLLFALYT